MFCHFLVARLFGVGVLKYPTGIELEYLSQARSDHCNHNTFRGIFRYHNLDTGDKITVNNLFKTCIEALTLALKAKKPWVISVLWDNAGAARFDDDLLLCHNRKMCLAYGIPLLSGKDSMYVDGHLPGKYGETHKVSALKTLQFSASSIISDITRCVTMDPKAAGDLVYVLGTTRNELGGSEYYDHFGYVGLNVPLVFPDQFLPMYRALSTAIENRLVASCHGIYSVGLGIHLALMVMASNPGMTIDLSQLPVEEPLRDDQALFSESAGRFIVTVSADNEQAFEELMLKVGSIGAAKISSGEPAVCIGKTTEEAGFLEIRGQSKDTLLRLSIAELKTAWKKPFGALI